jgi:hypothetical protein
MYLAVMNMRWSFWMLLLLTAGCSRCKDEQPVVVTPAPFVKLVFDHVVGPDSLFNGVLMPRDTGEALTTTLLKYYVSHAVLVTDAGDSLVLNDYSLVDALTAGKNTVKHSGTVAGEYTRLRFQLGVDQAHNHTGAQTGALDPINGMLWTWNTGYVFFKHEGTFVAQDNSVQALAYHYGTDAALTYVDLPCTVSLTADGSATVHVRLDLQALYGSPTFIGFENNNIHQSVGAGDAAWMQAMRSNMPVAFSCTEVVYE